MTVAEIHTKSNHARYDVAVIGGGVVGCAVARRLTLEGARVVLLERSTDILSGASKANSALLHTGFDAPAGSLELDCMKAGYREYLAIRDRLNLPLLETGALVIAWNDFEREALDDIAIGAGVNGVDDVRLLTAEEVLQREPMLASTLKAGLFVPREHVIDPWSAPLAYVTQAIANGATVMTRSEVVGGVFRDGTWEIRTPDHVVEVNYVVNCAGLFGDHVEAALLGDPSFTIKPRKGQFVIFDKAASKLLTTTILPVPSRTTKGVVLARTIFGNLLVGPTAEEQDDRDHAEVTTEMLQGLLQRAAEILPALADMPVTAIYAGLRPASERKDYRIRNEPSRNWLTLGGIRSTGLTSALGLAQFAASSLAGMGWTAKPRTDPVWPALPNLAEHRKRDWQTPGHGEIVCHCEMVTRREIEAALASPLPPGDIGGLKRRTRASMGRCQGFYCGARLGSLTAGRFTHPLTVGSDDER